MTWLEDSQELVDWVDWDGWGRRRAGYSGPVAGWRGLVGARLAGVSLAWALVGASLTEGQWLEGCDGGGAGLRERVATASSSFCFSDTVWLTDARTN